MSTFKVYSHLLLHNFISLNASRGPILTITVKIGPLLAFYDVEKRNYTERFINDAS